MNEMLRKHFLEKQNYIIEIPINEKYYIWCEGLNEFGETITKEQFDIENIKNVCVELFDNNGNYIKTL
jgi:predicted secreted protein